MTLQNWYLMDQSKQVHILARENDHIIFILMSKALDQLLLDPIEVCNFKYAIFAHGG